MRHSAPPAMEPHMDVFSISQSVNPISVQSNVIKDDDNKSIMDPRSCTFRFIVLFFNCILTFGPYFCYDMPTVLQNEIQGIRNTTCERLQNVSWSEQCCSDCLGLSPTNFNLLFAVFSWVNAVTVLFTGYLTDKLGNRIAVLTFSSVTLVGTALFAGATTQLFRHTSAMFPLMLIGRMMLGSGNGGMRIVQDRVTAFWFKDKEMAMAFGIMLSFSRLGSVLNFFVTVEVEESFGITGTFFAGASLCGLGFVCAIFLSALDRHGVKKLGLDEDLLTQSKKVEVSDVRHFPGVFWLLVLTIAAIYSALLPFVADSSKFLQDEYRYSKTTASYIAGSVYDVALIFSPICGILLDRFGRRGFVSIGCTIALLAVYLIFLFTEVPPIYLTITLGIAYTLAAISLWPSVTMVVSGAHLGTAMGLTTCLLDIGRGISNLIVGKLLGDSESEDLSERSKKWRHVLIFLSCLAGLALICTVCLNLMDQLKYKILNTAKAKKSEDQETDKLVNSETETY